MSSKLDKTKLSWGSHWAPYVKGTDMTRMSVAKYYLRSMLNQVPDKHAVGNLVFSFHSGSSSDNHEVRKWTFDFLSKSILWQSCSQELDVLKWQQPHSSQSGWFLRQSWCHEPGSPLSFHVAVSDKHAVRISTWVLRNPQFQVSAFFGVWLPWVANLQGDRHLCRPIQVAGTGVNLRLWHHPDTKAKEKVAVLFSLDRKSVV